MRQKGFAPILIVLAAIVLIGGGLGYRYFFREPLPENVVREMLGKLFQIKSFTFSGELSGEVSTSGVLGVPLLPGSGSPLESQKTSPSGPPSNFAVKTNGSVDIRDFSNATFSLELVGNADLVPAEKTPLGIEVRLVNNILYLRLATIPKLGFLDLSFLSNTWIKVEVGNITKHITITGPEENLSAEKKEKLKEAFQNSHILKVAKVLPTETLDSVKTYHYAFVVDKDAVRSFAAKASTILAERPLTEKERQDLDERLAELEVAEGELWIGKNDFLPYKVTFTLSGKQSKMAQAGGRVAVSASLKNFDAPVRVEIPSSAKAVEEIFSEFSKSFQGLQFSLPQLTPTPEKPEPALPIEFPSSIPPLAMSPPPAGGETPESPAVGEVEIGFETVYEGVWIGPPDKKNYVINTEEEWRNLWDIARQHEERNPPKPAVDFTTHTVLAVFMGEKPTGGYDVHVARVFETENRIRVLVREVSPGKRCLVTQGLSSPHHIVKISKTAKWVDFVSEREAQDCN